jgi:streptogramin lyase
MRPRAIPSGGLSARALAFVLLLGHSAALRGGQIETIAGTGREADGGAEGPALKTNVGNPFGVEIGPDGALYITEVSNHRVRRLDQKSGRLTTVAGCGRKGYAGDGGPATEALLNEPYEVRFDADGHMYFVEMQNHVVRRVDAKTKRISTIAGTGQGGFGGDGGPATKATMLNPHSIALDGRGGLYVADIGNHRIRRVDLKTGLIDTIAGNGERKLPANGETVKGKPILGPRALAIDGRMMWIALREGNSVWALDMKSLVILHVAGTGEKGYSGDGGPARRATFNGPKGIAVGPNRHVYLVDTENQVIRHIDPFRNAIDTVAGAGPKARGYNGDSQEATKAHLNRPHGICIGRDGAIYIGDSENHRVRRVEMTR